MIIKNHYADALLHIAIALSIFRSDLSDTLHRSLTFQSHLQEINVGPLSGITRTDWNTYFRGFVGDYPKVVDSYSEQFSSVLTDLHSLSYYRRFDGISTNVYAWLLNDGGSDSRVPSGDHSTEDADEISTGSQNASSLPAADEVSSSVASEPNDTNLFVEDELSKEVVYLSSFV